MPQQSLFGPSFSDSGHGRERRAEPMGPEVSSELALAVSSDEVSASPQQEERRYRRILARKEKLGDLFGMAACYIRLGDLYLARGDSEQAGDLYRKSLRLARAANTARKSLAPEDLS